MAFFAAGCNQNSTTNNPPTVQTQISGKSVVTISNHQVKVEVADTIESRAKGLGGRESLPANDGMLFVFPQPDKYGFWMKDMKIPLDFIWIRNHEVVEITHDVYYQPNVLDAVLTIYRPAQPVDQVLEVNAGWAAENNIKVGDSVNLTKE